MQLDHQHTKFDQKKFPVIIFCDQLRTPENVGMIFRLADAFGVEKIYLNELSPKPGDRSVKRIARSVNESVPSHLMSDPLNELSQLRKLNYKIIALEITQDSKPIQNLKLDLKDKLVIVIGAERNGIEARILDLCDEKIHIPMYGINSSMNVANSLSIALYEITNQFNSL